MSDTAISIARALHARHTGPQHASFEQVLGWYLADGVVWSTPQEFLLARPGWWDGRQVHLDKAPANCWLVHCAVGVGRKHSIQSRLPYRLNHIAWHRRGGNKLRVASWERMKAL